jgi:hypothetical protein
MTVKIKHKSELKQSSAKVTVQKPDGAVVETEELVSEQIFEGPVANVGVTAGLTRNVGNYNSVKLSVSLHLPCGPSDIDSTFDFVQMWVNTRMEMLADEIDKA